MPMQITRDRNAFYLTGKVGLKRSTTPEGFLVCHDVPIARVGMQLYTDAEVPITGDQDGLVRINRTEEQVFSPATIASFEGKPVTVNHPDEFVNPDNWKNLTIGFVQNVRRGDGIGDDLLLADLVITDADGIRYVNDELPEVSCGYEADYEEVAPGHGEQLNIIGNHVALVDKGRAGSRCAIQDSEPNEVRMKPEKKRQSFLDRLKAMIKDAEAEETEKEEETTDEELEKKEEKEEKTTDSDLFESRLARIEAVISKLVPIEEAEHGTQLDEEMKAEEEEEETVDNILEPEGTDKIDQGTVIDSLKEVIALAEILSPGIQIPTGDAVKDKKAIPRLQAKSVQSALTTDEGKKVVEPFLKGRELGKLTFTDLSAVFTGAAELMRQRNNDKLGALNQIKDSAAGRQTIQDINARNKAVWANQK